MKFRKFGKKPSGARLERVLKSPQFKDGKFRNLSHTPSLTEGHNYLGVTKKFFFNRDANRLPDRIIPSVKTDLLNLRQDENVLIWFGHSSYFLHIDGKNILVDPVFSGNASPLPSTNKAFEGADIYKVEDMPEIDYLFITHDHYDHLDYSTVISLQGRVGTVICGLGVGEHLEHWGYEANKILEGDWNDRFSLSPGFSVVVTPARHFSGRGFTRDNTLWCSYVLKTPSAKLYLGGDSGYDTHFAEIGNQHGPFDLAILENGQYDDAWIYIHMHPEDVLRAGRDLNARRVFPVHSGKFSMANHAWDEPLKRVVLLNQQYRLNLITPMIGEKVELDNPGQQFSNWWIFNK